MAHDLGHPPFGHVGESSLDTIARSNVAEGGLGLADGFEGNAQSIRVVTIGSLRSPKYEGLDLTCATLAAISKYPWCRRDTLDGDKHIKSLKKDADYRREWRKFNFYSSQKELVTDIRAFASGKISEKTQTLEASVMDVADDISYAVHDLEDFFLAGIVNIPRVMRDLDEFVNFLQRKTPLSGKNAFVAAVDKLRVDYKGYYDDDHAAEAGHEILKYFRKGFTADPIVDAILSEPSAREVASDLIERYIGGIECRETVLWKNGPHLGLGVQLWHEVQLLKQITRSYVISRPDFALHQRGQQMILTGLVRLLSAWAVDKDDEVRLPAYVRSEIELATEQAKYSPDEMRQKVGFGPHQRGKRGERNRAIVDYICTLGDAQCRNLYSKLSGSSMHVVHGFSGIG